jgi:hypothetical protein
MTQVSAASLIHASAARARAHVRSLPLLTNVVRTPGEHCEWDSTHRNVMNFDLTQPFSTRNRGSSMSQLFAQQFAKKKKEVRQGASTSLQNTFQNSHSSTAAQLLTQPLTQTLIKPPTPLLTLLPPLWPRRHRRISMGSV